MIVAFVIAGGGLGATARWLMTVWLGTSAKGFPVGTTIVNIVGSFLLGVLIGVDVPGSVMTDPLAIGFLGGFTTFSTWMVEIDRASTNREKIVVGGVPLLAGLAGATVGLLVGYAFGS